MKCIEKWTEPIYGSWASNVTAGHWGSPWQLSLFPALKAGPCGKLSKPLSCWADGESKHTSSSQQWAHKSQLRICYPAHQSACPENITFHEWKHWAPIVPGWHLSWWRSILKSKPTAAGTDRAAISSAISMATQPSSGFLYFSLSPLFQTACQVLSLPPPPTTGKAGQAAKSYIIPRDMVPKHLCIHSTPHWILYIVIIST